MTLGGYRIQSGVRYLHADISKRESTIIVMFISDLRIVSDRPSTFLDLRVVVRVRLIQVYKLRLGIIDDEIEAETFQEDFFSE